MLSRAATKAQKDGLETLHASYLHVSACGRFLAARHEPVRRPEPGRSEHRGGRGSPPHRRQNHFLTYFPRLRGLRRQRNPGEALTNLLAGPLCLDNNCPIENRRAKPTTPDGGLNCTLDRSLAARQLNDPERSGSRHHA